MQRLASLQARFSRSVLEGSDAAWADVAGDARLDPGARLSIYANAYRARLLEVLGKDFACVKAQMGEEAFEAAALAYAAAHPSRSPSLRWFGRAFATFLRRAEPYADAPALAETAAFEWALGEAFDAADDPSASLADAAAVPPEAWARLRLAPRASLRTLRLAWSVPAAYAAMERGERPAPERLRAPVTCLVWRADGLTRWRSLAAEEAEILSDALCGRTFGALCEALAERGGEEAAPARAAALLARWIEEGLFTRLEAETAH